MRPRSALSAEQLAEVRRIVEMPAAGLFLRVGFGKTIVTLTAIVDLMDDRCAVGRVLVIAPPKVVETVWQNEAPRWEHTRHLRFSVALGDPKRRRRALEADADVYVVSRDVLPWLVETYGAAWRWDMVVLDELKGFKEPGTVGFKAMKKVRGKIARLVELSASVGTNGHDELYAPVGLLDLGERLGKTRKSFRERFMVPDKVGRQGEVWSWKVRSAEAEEEMYRAIDDICSARPQPAGSGPIIRDVELELPPELRRQYRRLEREAVLRLENGQVVMAPHAGAVVMKLRQFASGWVKDDQGAIAKLHEIKLDALERLVEAAEGDPILVFPWFREDVGRIVDRIPDAVMYRADRIPAWQRGEIPVMLLHPASAGHGVDGLQHGGATAVWYSPVDSLDMNIQANGRLARTGQKEQVYVHRLVMKGTRDEDIVRNLAEDTMVKDRLDRALIQRVMEDEEVVA